MSQVQVLCSRDEDAQVWIATSEDLPGLVLEADFLDTLAEKIKNAVPELLEIGELTRGNTDGAG